MEVDSPQPVASIGLGDYLSVFSRRFWVILIPFLLVVGLAAALGFLLPAQYQAKTRIQVLDRSALDQFYETVEVTVPYKPYLSTIREHIKRRKFLQPLVQELGITEGFDYSDARDRARLYDRVMKNLQVTYVEQKVGPNLIGLSYTGRGARKVANFINAVRDRYQDEILRRYKKDITDVRDDLWTKLQDAERAVKEAANAWVGFKETHEDFYMVGDRVHVDTARNLAAAKVQLAGLQRSLDGKEKALDTVKARLRETEPEIVGASKRERNPAYVEQEQIVARAAAVLKAAEDRWLPTHPQIPPLKARLEVEKAKLQETLEFLDTETRREPNPVWQGLKSRQDELEAEIAGERARIATLKRRIKDLEAAVAKIPGLTRQANELQADLEKARIIRDRILRRYQQVEGFYNRINSKEGGFFWVIDQPILEEADAWDPVFPNLPLFLGVGAFVGLLLGTGIAFLVEFTSRSYVTVSQVRRTLPLPLLGEVGVIRTPREQRRRLRNRVALIGTSLAVVGLLVYAHVCYFTKQLQPNLPPWLFDLMKRFYGAQ